MKKNSEEFKHIETMETQEHTGNMDVVYFSVNNWFRGRDYPSLKCFDEWLGDDLKQNFMDDAWCKKNKLCVYQGVIDMSFNYTVSAPREWVEKNCPELLTDKEYTYSIICSSKNGTVEEKYTKKYSDFVYTPDADDETPECDGWYQPFRKYCEKNFGSEYYEEVIM